MAAINLNQYFKETPVPNARFGAQRSLHHHDLLEGVAAKFAMSDMQSIELDYKKMGFNQGEAVLSCFGKKYRDQFKTVKAVGRTTDPGSKVVRVFLVKAA